jgi:dipeptidyl aminopeptidase/acylaminoacyl peptidase
MLKRFVLMVASIALTSLVTAQSVTSGRLLVWAADGAGPEAVGASTPGQIGYMDASGVLTPINLTLPTGIDRVMKCGITPDGNRIFLYVGQVQGTLYALDNGATEVTMIDDLSALACAGNTAFQISPDGTRFAYLDFEPSQPDEEFSDGRLRVVTSSDLAPVSLRENDIVDTAAFDLTNETLAFIRLPQTGERREALEAVINVVNGAAITPVATLRPDAENTCRFTSASIKVLPNGNYLALMGQKCRQGDPTSTWHLYLIDATARETFTKLADGQAGGTYLPETRNNNIVIAPNGNIALFSLPDGLEGFSAMLYQLNLADNTVTTVVPIGVRYPRVANRGYFLDETGTPRLSSDRNYYTFAQKDPDNNQTLYIVNLDAQTQQAYAAPNEGDVISNMLFTPDNRRVAYLQGGTASQENTLMLAEVDSETTLSILRGRFAYPVMSPDGSQVALMEWQTVEDPNQPPYQSLAVVDLATSGYIQVWNQGAVITADGKVTEQKFVYPIAWMK